ncbi:MAG: anti-sigma factor, partial [Leptolyngbya sp. SIO1D8]|nr:anti-sigma factor [Leptolyngbya sp. SIO1D8]
MAGDRSTSTEHYCFCELAPLYALDMLSAPERVWVEQQVAECPELSEELASYESTATAIPYSAPAMPMATDLKHRLFDQLGLETPSVKDVPSPS